MKVLIGFIIGILFVFVIGAVGIEEYLVTVRGAIVSSNYQSTFSGMTPDGECYLAVTNTQNGTTEIVKITKNLSQMFEGKTLEKGSHGRAILKL